MHLRMTLNSELPASTSQGLQVCALSPGLRTGEQTQGSIHTGQSQPSYILIPGLVLDHNTPMLGVSTMGVFAYF